ncbi:transcriptional regulator STERILE APETALA [Senna tora]|uniref:Transcriptional regulator STERILE APETALA n=1 Tax=Senna tora TaxID=362788 RepID=A0A835C4P9_9FABA|nr:transcriptional regulator STERILE APETALA [Senna tora]
MEKGNNPESEVNIPIPRPTPTSKSTPRHRDPHAPPSSRPRRAMNDVLPVPFLESIATQVAIDTARSSGRLAVGPALGSVFQVCSTWRAVSRSEHLWETLTWNNWGRANRTQDTWHEEFIHLHRMARNFAIGRYAYASLHFDPSDVEDADASTVVCRCLALSDVHLACGFADGTVRLFDLETRVHVSTFQSHHGDRIGPFSRSVSGMVLTNERLVFARLDGDVYVALLDGPDNQTRRAHGGDVVNNGVLVEFAGCGRWWVGLFAGVPGRAFQIWDAHTEELVFMGGSLTDPETVMGWHMLTELTEPVGRVRVTDREIAVACTSSQLIVFHLGNPEILLYELWSTVGGFVVTSLDVSDEALFIVERNGDAKVRRALTLEQLCEFRVRGAASSVRGLLGCRNVGYALTCAGGVVRVWDVERAVGRQRLMLGERVGEANAMVCNERHVAVSCNDTSIHLWDFDV